jgi:hypothetical protein
MSSPITVSLSEHLTVRKKAIFDQFEDLALVCSGFLEHLRMGDNHGVGGENLGRRFNNTKEGDKVCEEGGEMVVAMRNGLGFGLSFLFIAMAVKVALNDPHYFIGNFGFVT